MVTRPVFPLAFETPALSHYHPCIFIFIFPFLRKKCETFLSSVSGDQEREEGDRGFQGLGLGLGFDTTMDSPETAKTTTSTTKSSSQSPPLQVTTFPPIPPPETAATTATTATSSSKSPPVQVITFLLICICILLHFISLYHPISYLFAVLVPVDLDCHFFFFFFLFIFLVGDGHFRQFFVFSLLYMW